MEKIYNWSDIPYKVDPDDYHYDDCDLDVRISTISLRFPWRIGEDELFMGDLDDYEHYMTESLNRCLERFVKSKKSYNKTFKIGCIEHDVKLTLDRVEVECENIYEGPILTWSFCLKGLDYSNSDLLLSSLNAEFLIKHGEELVETINEYFVDSIVSRWEVENEPDTIEYVNHEGWVYYMDGDHSFVPRTQASDAAIMSWEMHRANMCYKETA